MSAKTGNISLAQTPEAIARCHAVMRELRPQFDDEAQFVARVTQQISEGYHLAYLESEGAVRSCAGYRFTRTLSWGFHLYVDDLITRAVDREGGFGSQLFDWLVAEARRRGCESFHLDSGVQRFGAHRFYLHKRMDIIAHHFSLGLDS
jgi:GNAT superfamily N-acetyltransferase